MSIVKTLQSLQTKAHTMHIDPATFGKDDVTGEFFYPFSGGSTSHFCYSGHESSLKAYQKCAPVTAIINRKAQAYINGKTWVLNTKGQGKGKEATNEAAVKLRKLLAAPNPLQSWKQFEAQGYIYQQLFGYNIVLPIKPIGFKENIDATSLWNIPPTMVDIEETQKLFYRSDLNGIIGKITLTYKGQRTTLQAKDVYIMKDFTPSFDSLVLPESRIRSLEIQINNIVGAYESRNVLINYRGALGILSQDPGSGQYGAIPMSPTEKGDLQNEFRRYGLSRKQWQFIITSASLKWQQMGVPTKDLMLFEEIRDDIMRICESYSYPYQLMSSDAGTTFSNLKEGKQLLYQDATIPEAENIYEQWNQFFSLDAYAIKMDKDFSHIAVLQADKVNEATARKTLNEAKKIEYESGLITLNQWLIALGEDPMGLEGEIRATDVKNSNVPLATLIGVGGVQSVIAIVTAPGMTEEAKRATLEILFGLSPADAARMAVTDTAQTNQNGNQQQTTEGAQQSQGSEGGS